MEEKFNIELETYDRDKPTPFAGWNKINRVKTTFTNGGKIRRLGKEINLQKHINENNNDCTIYDVYDKYRGDKKLTQAQLNTLTHKISDELSGVKDLKTALDVINSTKRTWNELPNEIRKEFDNNIETFRKNGAKWANNKIKIETDKIKAQQAELKRLEAEANKQVITGDKLNG